MSSGKDARQHPIIALVLVCVVAGALLGVVHALTAPRAAANAEEKAQKTYASLVPEAESFQEIPVGVEGVSACLKAIDTSGATIAHIVVASSRGYGGQVPLAVAFAADGKVRSIVAMSNSETPGLGSRIAEDPFIGQFVGREATSVTSDDIDLISGATISSKAALEAFNAAVRAYEEVSR